MPSLDGEQLPATWVRHLVAETGFNRRGDGPEDFDWTDDKEEGIGSILAQMP
jgi:hypothetical protein